MHEQSWREGCENAYEAQRNKNIEANNAILESLCGEAASDFKYVLYPFEVPVALIGFVTNGSQS